MILLEVNASTWMITGVGFLLVLLLLVVFVFVLKFLGWVMQPRVKPKQQVETKHSQTVAHTQKEDRARITLTADSTAAIALALYLYYNGVHDEENTKTIVQPHRTQWNNKMYGMNNLHR